ncbi:Membrane associated serine protease, rhomboid family [Granulicella pectinivorans]|uniref:Membrane associated serine protease, rhomboid family n=1 Tax=Granulicella pectinivorans TaxID=474950 RepID=A0A1I6LRK1_9BACT|nr:rhomboid family intramembrane serine protease [Granulicella pectinivorans]SFS06058.1 Membrane associated serine protease, rhomboid family [Granulicella pectinivorans]
MARGPITLTFPPFHGATRRLVLISLGAFFAIAVLGSFSPDLLERLLGFVTLIPATLFHGQVWQLFTYEFVVTGILNTIFWLLTLWFFGSQLEDQFGSRWLTEYYLLTSAAGALFAALLAMTGLFRMSPLVAAAGPRGAILALLVASAYVSGEEMIRFNFIFTLKLKYLVAIYGLYYLAILILGPNRFGALTCLCCGLAGYLYMRYAPRRGFLPNASFNLSERYYAMRNDYYRRKRRNAAKKFEVYMRKQDREVHFDKEGRYVAPDDKDPTDKRWMN